MTNEDEAAETQRRGDELLADGQTEDLLAQYRDAYERAMAARRYDLAAKAVVGMDDLVTKHTALFSKNLTLSEARKELDEAKRRLADEQGDND
ncbi:hypothetical protein E4P29_05430 [Rhodococcus sp. 1R11]|uniref:hypothetical protein n=1 Tax=Rhodococcus sp. 1R11 TaxID=2559614 RepID=UPI001072DF87|nr:hypothetical protein [Rhodococcus sp. 1R11]TFI45158.1 hypothetical protein E4P29_05430 [Rhodococcus sp. 1R11]